MSIEAVQQHIKDGSMEEAVKVCEALLSRSPKDFNTQLMLGQLYCELGRADEAILVFRKLIESQPQNYQAMNFLAVALTAQNETDEALTLYDQALQIVPDFALGLANKADLLQRSGRYAEARDVYKEIVKHYPDSALGHISLARTHLLLGNVDLAADLFDKALNISESKHTVLAEIASAYQDIKDWPNTIKFLQDAIKQAPEEDNYHLNLARAYGKKGDHEKAEKVINNALQTLESSADMFNELGLIKKRAKQLDEAARYFESAINLDSDHAESWGNIGSIHRKKGNQPEALRCYNKALSLNPNLTFVHFARARIFTFSQGDAEFDELAALKYRADLSLSEKCHLAFSMGKALDDLGDYPAAFKEYQTANTYRRADTKLSISAQTLKMRQCIEYFDKPVLPEDTNNNLPDLVLVMGMTRSGKTLTESILAQHSHVHDLGEDKRLPDALTKLIDEKSEEKFPHGLDSISADKIKDIGQQYLRMLKDEKPDAKIFINTLPSMVSFVGVLFRAIPSLRVIDCKRHILDQCLESYFKNYNEGNEYSYDLSWLGEYWQNYRLLSKHWRELYRDRILTVEYEKLVTEPNSVLPKIYSHCGLAYSENSQKIELNTDSIGRWRNYATEIFPAFSNLAKIE